MSCTGRNKQCCVHTARDSPREGPFLARTRSGRAVVERLEDDVVSCLKRSKEAMTSLSSGARSHDVIKGREMHGERGSAMISKRTVLKCRPSTARSQGAYRAR